MRRALLIVAISACGKPAAPPRATPPHVVSAPPDATPTPAPGLEVDIDGLSPSATPAPTITVYSPSPLVSYAISGADGAGPWAETVPWCSACATATYDTRDESRPHTIVDGDHAQLFVPAGEMRALTFASCPSPDGQDAARYTTCVSAADLAPGTYQLSVTGGVDCPDAPGFVTLPLTSRVVVHCTPAHGVD